MNSIKRFFAIVLALMFLLPICPVKKRVIHAAEGNNPGATIEVDKGWARPNEAAYVNVRIKNNPGIMGATLKLTYDAGLTLVEARNGEAFSALDLTLPGELVSGCNFPWDAMDLDPNDIKDGVILSLKFEVSENAAVGNALNISLSCVPDDVYDRNYETVPISFIAGNILVIDYTPGDVNGDGVVNTKDVSLIRRWIAGGYGQTIDERAGDVNNDGKINTKDVSLIRRFIAGGYGTVLTPQTPRAPHTMEHIPFKDATCTEDGNIEYWHCTTCGKYFNDEAGTVEITLEDTVIKAKGHTIVIDPRVEPTEESTGLTEGKHCSVCGAIIVPQEVIPKLEPEHYSIVYHLYDNDSYLEQVGVENPNPDSYTTKDGLLLSNLNALGYIFQGWYDGPGDSGSLIKKIEPGTTGNVELYARWTAIEYDITYKAYKTPLAPITDERYLHYTINKGLNDLPNPEIYNYVFFGWYNDDEQEVTNIPVGSTGDIALNGYWTSKRYLAKKVDHLEDPLICTDIDNGVIYFAYEIGTIENIPLIADSEKPIWVIQSVAGLAQQQSQSVETEISTECATGVIEAISKSTVDSRTWTLSEDWTEGTQVNELWAEQNGMTLEEAEMRAKSSSGTYLTTDSWGGCNTTSTTDGSTALTYDSQNDIKSSGAHLDANMGGSTTVGVEGGVPEVVKGKVEGTFEWGVEGGLKWDKQTNKHSGTDTTTIDTTVKSDTSSWNKVESSSQTNTASESITTSRALSQLISSSKGYGKSYSWGGSGSEAWNAESAASESVNTSSTLSYFTSQIKTTTTTYSTDGKSEGCYRLVIAGKAHVFAVVGYDVASKSYFTYTYNVLEDRTYEFLDYSPDLSFDDCEYGVLPFEVPYFVYEYVSLKTTMTEGLQFKTDSSTGTATVTGYSGTETDVLVPTYYSFGNTYYKVTGISANAFAGKPIRALILGDFIKEIPDSAFKNCTALEEVSGWFTQIGNEAFSGCTGLENFNVSPDVTAIGENAFAGVPMITVDVLSADSALKAAEKSNPEAGDAQKNEIAMEITQNVINSAINSGAQKVALNIAWIIDGIELTLDVPELEYFELLGNAARSYTNLKLTSHADTTVLRNLKITDCNRIPLEIFSDNLTLEVVHVQSPSYVLLLSNDNPNITLIRDSRFESLSGDAVVWKNPVLISTITDGAVGTLDVSGNVYVCGSITGLEYLTVVNGEIIYISEDEFENYVKGAFIIYFDPCGGTVGEASRMVTVGMPIGELPVPTKDYNTFTGWYTEAEGGVQVTAETIIEPMENQTLYAHWELNKYTLTYNANGGHVSPSGKELTFGESYGPLPTPVKDYCDFVGWFTAAVGGTQVSSSTTLDEPNDVTIYAHWKDKPISGWVKVQDAPPDAQIIERKWTYTKTTTFESYNTSEPGCTQIGFRWEKTASGSKNWASFPAGFDTTHSIYTSFAKSKPYSASETATTKREVTDAWAGYVYWHWMYDTNYANGTPRRAIYNQRGTGPTNDFFYKFFGAFTSTKGDYSGDTLYCNNLNIYNYIIPERTAWDDCQGATRWFRFDYRICQYTDYVKVFKYQKVENLESSTPIENGGEISNVQEWVRYRAK